MHGRAARATQFIKTHRDYFVVVKGEGRGERVYIPPASLGGIISAFYGRFIFNKTEEADGNLSSSRVAAHFTEGVHLAKLNASQTRFLREFADGSGLELFVHIYETAGDCPSALERFAGAFDQQDLCAGWRAGEDEGVNRDHRSGPVIDVGAFESHTIEASSQ